MFLNCSHNEIKLKQNNFETVSKLFWNCFVSVSFRWAYGFTGNLIACRNDNKLNTENDIRLNWPYLSSRTCATDVNRTIFPYCGTRKWQTIDSQYQSACNVLDKTDISQERLSSNGQEHSSAGEHFLWVLYNPAMWKSPLRCHPDIHTIDDRSGHIWATFIHR